MKAIIQRVKRAKVFERTIGKGLLIFVGFEKDDDESKVDKFVDKVLKLRIFEDENGKLNLSVRDVNGGIMLISNFTLAGSIRKGTRPSFTNAMDVQRAKQLYEYLLNKFKENYENVESGIFQSYMEIESTSYGPVNIIYSD